MTPELLRAATDCTPERAAIFAPLIDEAARAYAIDTPRRMAAFLAQVGHECGSFRWLSEIWGPTPAQSRYEGRADLGNTQPGDGSRFRGHGLIQATGRFNHARVRDRLRQRFADVPDFEAEPGRLCEPRWATLSAADYWDMRNCNALADSGDFEALTRKINGGLNGLADRIQRHERATRALAGQAIHTEEPAMPVAPFILAALPSIVETIPKLGKLFGSGSEVAERNVKAAELAVAIVQEATGARNAQEAAEVIKADPSAVQAAVAAVESRWYELTEAGGGGIDGARKANAEYMRSGAPGFWLNPAFWISLVLLSMPFMLLIDVFYVHPTSYVGEIRTQIVTGVLLCIGMVGGYWIGSSMGSAKKDDARTAP